MRREIPVPITQARFSCSARCSCRTRAIVATRRTTPDDHLGPGFPLFSPDGTRLHVMNEGAGVLVTFDVPAMTRRGDATPIGGASFGGAIRQPGRP